MPTWLRCHLSHWLCNYIICSFTCRKVIFPFRILISLQLQRINFRGGSDSQNWDGVISVRGCIVSLFSVCIDCLGCNFILLSSWKFSQSCELLGSLRMRIVTSKHTTLNS